MSRVGETILGFSLEALIAEGPRARVYRGRRGEELAAVKIYPPVASTERVWRERDAQVRIEHPCVAHLLASGVLDDGAMCLASEWVDGMRLEDRLALGTMTLDELAPILAAVARGLHAIHAAGIVHRDLKPSNILLPASGSPEAVILDFGESLVLADERLTTTGQILGSASYSAPEQASGQILDGRTDLYALGVIAYRALTGVLPFDHVSAAEILRKHMLEPVVSPRVRAPERDVPAAADDLCMWLLAKDPRARLPNARVLSISLQTMIGSARGEEQR